MRPIFTIHAGELLVGQYIEKHFPNTNIWLPGKDVGIDLLVTDRRNSASISLQVKSSRDFSVDQPAEFQKSLRACGWWTLNQEKLKASIADYWVLLVIGFTKQTRDYIIIPPKELLCRFERLHIKKRTWQSYLWVTKSGQCWETRGLRRTDQSHIIEGCFADPLRDFTPFLNNWKPIAHLNGK